MARARPQSVNSIPPITWQATAHPLITTRIMVVFALWQVETPGPPRPVAILVPEKNGGFETQQSETISTRAAISFPLHGSSNAAVRRFDAGTRRRSAGAKPSSCPSLFPTRVAPRGVGRGSKSSARPGTPPSWVRLVERIFPSTRHVRTKIYGISLAKSQPARPLLLCSGHAQKGRQHPKRGAAPPPAQDPRPRPAHLVMPLPGAESKRGKKRGHASPEQLPAGK